MTHALVISRNRSELTPDGHQVDGFQMHERELKDRLGMTVTMVDAFEFSRLDEVIRSNPCDVVFLLVHWSVPADALISQLHDWHDDPAIPPIVFIDYYAQTSTPHFGALPHVACYVKRQLLRDRSLYQKPLAGGYIFTDYLANEQGEELDGWHFGSTPDPACLDRLVTGWNLGVTDRYRKMLALARWFGPPWHARPYRLNCRISVKPELRDHDWYHRYRTVCVDALREAASGVGRCSPWTRCSPRRYYADLYLSRIVFSPFGWGEICFRDYEAVCAGALLIKPNMDHLETEPDVFVDGETYVGIQWDCADLAEKCRYYLRHPREARRIARNARQVMDDYFRNARFVDKIEEVMRCVHRHVYDTPTCECFGCGHGTKSL